MADVLCKTNLVSSPCGSCQTQQQNGVYGFPRSFRLKGFPLKVKPQTLRSQKTSFGTEFHGKRVAYRGNQRIPQKVLGIFSQPSIVAQVGVVLTFKVELNFIVLL
uniref:Thioredoxin-like 1-1ic n=1 Tax=Rhizophora mucronata TaxID=61149 RepID=A0A2P2MD34_RHIMU